MFRRLICFVSMILACIACNSGSSYVTINGYAQGGTYSVKARISRKYNPENIKSDIDSILSRIDKSVSGYNRESLLSAFNRGEKIVPDDIFCDILSVSRRLWEETSGTLDVSSAPLFDVWGFGFTTDSLPSDQVMQQARAASGMDRLKLSLEDACDSKGEMSSLSILNVPGPPAKLNFNAVAQGYSCDRIAAYLHSKGVENMLIDVGGEFFCEGVNPSGKNWCIGIDRPVDGNNIPGADMQGIFRTVGKACGVVTSGNYRKYYVHNGKKYSHTIDPRTGMPVSHSLLSATVIAGDASTADGYATACMVMGADDARSFASAHPEIKVCLIYDDCGTMQCWTSEGFTVEQL